MIRIGIIGLDSTHAPEFTRVFNTNLLGDGARVRVVAACAGAATDFPLSISRRERITRELTQDHQIPLLDSPLALAAAVDALMILSCDGRCHRREMLEVAAAGKPIFLDKPLSANWRDATAILEAAHRTDSPCFSASALRYRTGTNPAEIPVPERPADLDIAVPRRQEPGHPELSWHGIHGIESAFALLGTGCLSVQRRVTAYEDITTGTWADGSTARIRRIDDEAAGSFPMHVRSAGDEKLFAGHSYTGLLQVIADFFQSGIPPLSDRELLEPLAFAAAADASRDRKGAPVDLQDFLAPGSFEGELFSHSG
jgi:hypothetical protein